MNAIIGLAVALSLAPAPETPTLPKSPPPEFLRVSKSDQGRKLITTEVIVQRAVPVQFTEEITVNGVKETRTVTKLQTVQESRMQETSLVGATFTDGAGKKLTEEAAWKKLGDNKVVLLARAEVDPAYLKLLSADALIVIVKGGPAVAPSVPGTGTAPVPVQIKK